MRMILADDHVLFLDALEAYLHLLQPEMEIDKATDFDRALGRVRSQPPADLVMLDLNMPGMNEFEGLARIMEAMPGVPIVLMSGQAEASQVREGLRLGAAGFIPKNLDGKAMLKALELVLSGETFVPMLALEEGGPYLSVQRDLRQSPDNPLNQLTPRQHTVLKLLARGMTNKGIARELELKEVTVAAHLGIIFRKLGVSRRTEAISRASQLGMQL